MYGFHYAYFHKPQRGSAGIMDIFHNEFHPNLSINMEIMGRNLFIPTSKVSVSLSWSHKINLRL